MFQCLTSGDGKIVSAFSTKTGIRSDFLVAAPSARGLYLFHPIPTKRTRASKELVGHTRRTEQESNFRADWILVAFTDGLETNLVFIHHELSGPTIGFFGFSLEDVIESMELLVRNLGFEQKGVFSANSLS